MIETRRLKNVVIFVQKISVITIYISLQKSDLRYAYYISFADVLARKEKHITCRYRCAFRTFPTSKRGRGQTANFWEKTPPLHLIIIRE